MTNAFFEINSEDVSDYVFFFVSNNSNEMLKMVKNMLNNIYFYNFAYALMKLAYVYSIIVWFVGQLNI